ncbi:Nucleoside-diphosphate-sugar pyrophosphorylase family protein [Candidatus Nitrososphaera evergladensis SR1]|uniref:Nucleoside-diphosphate-sugar pyrophosphorylase family protein n=2 Tax=Nitrososphaera TaxID=497726 RepID=A0A075MX53_9ARCH|nr:Nucleoside-diphosphate-sugar pyrophosphorylase family protein [Candidatus Nitrososphaera evergladensis SR1]
MITFYTIVQEFWVMKAVILAGGFGKRLKPLTDQIPKPMIEVLNLPIIEWQIKWLAGNGIKEFIICVGYLKEQIINHIGSGSRLGVKVGYAVEEEPLGTGGALKNAEGLLSGQSEFFMLNGDILSNLDPLKLRDGGAAHALALVPLRSPYGVVEVDKANKVLGFVEKPRIKDRWINAGVYHFTSDVFSYLPENGNIETTALPALAKEGKLKATTYDSIFWRSIDSHKDIEEAAKEMQAANIS